MVKYLNIQYNEEIQKVDISNQSKIVAEHEL